MRFRQNVYKSRKEKVRTVIARDFPRLADEFLEKKLPF